MDYYLILFTITIFVSYYGTRIPPVYSIIYSSLREVVCGFHEFTRERDLIGLSIDRSSFRTRGKVSRYGIVYNTVIVSTTQHRTATYIIMPDHAVELLVSHFLDLVL